MGFSGKPNVLQLKTIEVKMIMGTFFFFTKGSSFDYISAPNFQSWITLEEVEPK